MPTRRSDAKKLVETAYQLGKEQGAILVDLDRRFGLGKPKVLQSEIGVPDNALSRAMRRGAKRVYEAH